MNTNNAWKFDANVAATFGEHARQHIPNYHSVIQKTVNYCCHHLTKDAHIVDIGCAVGETLRQLNLAGFTNLSGVDSSPDMISYCENIASIYCSSTFPDIQVDAAICNWTLHFIKDKEQYLQSVFNAITPGGFLILSEKTSVDPELVHFYHQFKSAQGVSDEDIKAKEAAVSTVMNIHHVEWYFSILKAVGFNQIDIIDADWCFTTFLARKD